MTIRSKSRPKGVAVAGVVDVVGGASRGRHCAGLAAPSVATVGAAELAKRADMKSVRANENAALDLYPCWRAVAPGMGSQLLGASIRF